jgi:hypothetical protein
MYLNKCQRISSQSTHNEVYISDFKITVPKSNKSLRFAGVSSLISWVNSSSLYSSLFFVVPSRRYVRDVPSIDAISFNVVRLGFVLALSILDRYSGLTERNSASFDCVKPLSSLACFIRSPIKV